MLEHRHPGLVEHLANVRVPAAGTTVWLARTRSLTVLVHCTTMASPKSTSYELRVDGRPMHPAGHELIARGGDVLQAIWFDAIDASANRVSLIRNGRRIASAAVPAPAPSEDRCHRFDGAVRLVSCTWIDVVEWRAPSAALAGRAPLDVDVRRSGPRAAGRSEPFWLLERIEAGDHVVLRFGVGRLAPGGYDLIVGSGSPAATFRVS